MKSQLNDDILTFVSCSESFYYDRMNINATSMKPEISFSEVLFFREICAGADVSQLV